MMLIVLALIYYKIVLLYTIYGGVTVKDHIKLHKAYFKIKFHIIM